VRCADEHLDEVVVQAIVKLALKCPHKLRMLEIARMHIEVISVNWNSHIFGIDDELNSVVVNARWEVEQRMFELWQYVENSLKVVPIGVIGHGTDCNPRSQVSDESA